MEKYIPTAINLPEGVRMELQNAAGHTRKCPTCLRSMSLSKKTLTKDRVRPLWLLSQCDGLTAEQIEQKLGRVAYTVYKRLKYWDFIRFETIKVDGKQKQKAIITDVGRRFLRNEITVPQWLWVYNDCVRRVPEDMYAPLVSFHDLVPYEEMNREIAAQQSIRLKQE